MIRILNLGSLNLDRVLRVDHIVKPGETVSARTTASYAGGKGANQSVALARAGAGVFHAGRVGQDGRWLIDKLNTADIDTSHVETDPDQPTGSAFIQVDGRGENAIVVDPGANAYITRAQIDQVLNHFQQHEILLLQNEISNVGYAIEAAAERGLSVCFNPAPITPAVADYPLNKVDLLIANHHEAGEIIQKPGARDLIPRLRDKVDGRVIITMGERGVVYADRQSVMQIDAFTVEPVDTIAAGDTFIGYFIAERTRATPIRGCLEIASAAAAICVTRPGAIDAIPTREEVAAFLTSNQPRQLTDS
ncbi:ribokinase [Mucisphaera calidilacus]|uniref:Ribokinase n=1 Tax=Mucisphaera calidilacus TaxID=2527982 RepID=A0A518BW52_9BACT|nr:ribokinase [Mucisphaera calidilacus]QDU71213.1 Ribokinase [Mucisphaera calidilacus]